jgi:hypothetical protein
MIMTEAYRRILARAVHGQLPQWVVEESEPDFRYIRELYEEKCFVGLHIASPHRSRAYVHLCLSKKGWEIYHRVRAAFPNT